LTEFEHSQLRWKFANRLFDILGAPVTLSAARIEISLRIGNSIGILPVTFVEEGAIQVGAREGRIEANRFVEIGETPSFSPKSFPAIVGELYRRAYRCAPKPVGWEKHGAPILRSDLQGGKTGAHKNGVCRSRPPN
jgi:hypothetical protein